MCVCGSVCVCVCVCVGLCVCVGSVCVWEVCVRARDPHLDPDSFRTMCAVVVVAVVAVVVIQGCLTLPHSVGVRYMGIGALVV